MPSPNTPIGCHKNQATRIMRCRVPWRAAASELRRLLVASICGSACLCSVVLCLNSDGLAFTSPSRMIPSGRRQDSGLKPVTHRAASDGAHRDLRSASALVVSVAMGSAVAGRRRRHHALSKGSLNATAADGDTESTGIGGDTANKEEKTPQISNDGPLDKVLKKWNSLSPDLKEDLKTFFSSLTVALAIRGFLVEPRFIPSLSMYPTFDVGDQLTVDKISKKWREYQRGDVIVFNPPPLFFEAVGQDRNGEALIKRIVAVEGDAVQVKNGGKLYINNVLQNEPYTNEDARYSFGPVKVPSGCVFVLGDNRNQSLDGHVWGFLPRENIIGRATLKFWPPWRVGGVAGTPP